MEKFSFEKTSHTSMSSNTLGADKNLCIWHVCVRKISNE